MSRAGRNSNFDSGSAWDRCVVNDTKVGIDIEVHTVTFAPVFHREFLKHISRRSPWEVHLPHPDCQLKDIIETIRMSELQSI